MKHQEQTVTQTERGGCSDKESEGERKKKPVRITTKRPERERRRAP